MPYQRSCREGVLKEGEASQAEVLLAGEGLLEGAPLGVVVLQVC